MAPPFFVSDRLPLVRPTPFPDLNALLGDLTDSARAILGADFVGAYLQGSFAVGDADEHSDVDFLVVVERELSSEQVAELQAMHEGLHDSGRAWAVNLEGSYFPRERLRQNKKTGEPLWYKDNGSRVLERSAHDDTLVVRWCLRGHGVVLAGPEPCELVERVSEADLKAEVSKTMRSWGKDLLTGDHEYAKTRWGWAYIVLSYCRMRHTLVTGRIESKRAGAEWALANLDPRWHDLIAAAWVERPDPWRKVHLPAEPQRTAGTLRFVRWAVGSPPPQYVNAA